MKNLRDEVVKREMGTFPIDLYILQPLQVLSEALGRFLSLSG
jgi:hypothetical protein